MKSIGEFLGEFPNWFARQKWSSIFAGCSGFILLLCCCGIFTAMLVKPSQALHTTESAGIAASPRYSYATPLPTFTEQSVQSPGVILVSPTATTVILPTATSTPAITVVI